MICIQNFVTCDDLIQIRERFKFKGVKYLQMI